MYFCVIGGRGATERAAAVLADDAARAGGGAAALTSGAGASVTAASKLAQNASASAAVIVMRVRLDMRSSIRRSRRGCAAARSSAQHPAADTSCALIRERRAMPLQ